MNRYLYRYLRLSEIDRFKQFIELHWRSGHILSWCDPLIRFQYEVPNEDRLTIAVAENSLTGEIDGVYGYISSDKYDSSPAVLKTLWGAVWKVRDDIDNPDLGKVGMGLLKFILRNEPAEVFASLGISGIHKGIALKLNYEVGEMNHWYIANPSVTEFKVAVWPHVMYEAKKGCSYLRPVILSSCVNIENPSNPQKSIEYFINRYAQHPYYDYRFIGWFAESSLIGLFVIRKVHLGFASVLRIVDFIGDASKADTLEFCFQDMLREEGAEYVDCRNYGIDDDAFLKWGFVKAVPGSETVIPEYFEPFERRYVKLEYAYISPGPLVVFKADGDQDRPNILPQ